MVREKENVEIAMAMGRGFGCNLWLARPTIHGVGNLSPTSALPPGSIFRPLGNKISKG
jgi:hypothetical protein